MRPIASNEATSSSDPCKDLFQIPPAIVRNSPMAQFVGPNEPILLLKQGPPPTNCFSRRARSFRCVHTSQLSVLAIMLLLNQQCSLLRNSLCRQVKLCWGFAGNATRVASLDFHAIQSSHRIERSYPPCLPFDYIHIPPRPLTQRLPPPHRPPPATHSRLYSKRLRGSPSSNSRARSTSRRRGTNTPKVPMTRNWILRPLSRPRSENSCSRTTRRRTRTTPSG